MVKALALIVTSLCWTADVSAQKKEVARGWNNESQLGVVKTTGNTNTESYRLRQTVTYRHGPNSVKLNGSYLSATSKIQSTGAKVETAKKWDTDLRLEHQLDERWNILTGYLLESNKFAGFRQRHNSDVGLKYFFWKKEDRDLFIESGYRYVHENRVDNSRDYRNRGRFYTEGNMKFNVRNRLKVWAEYIPSLDDGDDFLVNYEVSLTSSLTEKFALKVAYQSNYDNMPAVAKKKEDTTLTTSLVATF